MPTDAERSPPERAAVLLDLRDERGAGRAIAIAAPRRLAGSMRAQRRGASRPSPTSANAQQRFRDRTAAIVILDLISRPGAVLVSPAPPPRAVNASARDTLCPRYQEAGDEPGTTLSLTYLDVVANDRNDGAQSVASFPTSTAMFEPDACSDLRAIDERGVLAEALTLLGITPVTAVPTRSRRSIMPTRWH